MGIFGDLDLKQAEDDPFAIPDNTYQCTVTEVRVPNKNGKVGLALTYTVQEGDLKGRQISEYKTIPDEQESEEGARHAAFLKQRLLSLGVPADKVNDIEPGDLIGTDVYVTVKTTENDKGKYTNVRNVKLVTA